MIWVTCPCDKDHKKLAQMQPEVYKKFGKDKKTRAWAWHNPHKARLLVGLANTRPISTADMEGIDEDIKD